MTEFSIRIKGNLHGIKEQNHLFTKELTFSPCSLTIINYLCLYGKEQALS